MEEYHRLATFRFSDYDGRVLLSVRPPFAAMLLDGRKTVELRRRGGLNLAGRTAVVWETAPVSAAVGFLRFGSAWRSSPALLWDQMRMAGRVGMSQREFHGWCGPDAKEVTGVFVETAARRDPVPLAALRKAAPGFRPPRSWQRLPAAVEDALRARWVVDWDV